MMYVYQEKLAKEVDDMLIKNDNMVTYECLQNMPYLDMCFKGQNFYIIMLNVIKLNKYYILETLRKYPPLPFLDRECTKLYKFPNSNLIIDKGMIVYIPMMGLHHDPDFFPEPEKFLPERFSKENMENIRPFTFMPFGEGPRICIGKIYRK